MASTTLSPETCDSLAIEDPVSFKEACLLFGESNIRVSEATLTGWVKRDRIPREWRGRKAVVSFSDLLEAYARRYPAPGAP